MKFASVEAVGCLKINAPELFEDDAFVAWLNGNYPPATWHDGGGDPGEASDVFVTYDHGDGSDMDNMPAHCWEALRATCDGAGFTYGVLWLTNLPD